VAQEALTLRRLNTPEEVSGFVCQWGTGAADLEEFLKVDSFSYERRHLGRTYLAWSEADLVGFLTLSCATIAYRKEGKQVWQQAGIEDIRHAIPGVLLGRLAVDDRYQGRGIGSTLFRWAVRIARGQTAPWAGCRFLIIDAYARRREWYERRGCHVIQAVPPPNAPGDQTVKMCFDLFPHSEPTLDMWG
jgi:GNAT superfamily N-acetyltransferase